MTLGIQGRENDPHEDIVGYKIRSFPFLKREGKQLIETRPESEALAEAQEYVARNT